MAARTISSLNRTHPYIRRCTKPSACSCSSCRAEQAFTLTSNDVAEENDSDEEEVEEQRTDPLANVKWSKDHNDPSAEVVFVSRFKIHYRVHRWYLERASDFFKDMLSVPFTSPPSPPIIETEIGMWVIETIIELLYFKSSTKLSTLRYEQLEDMYEFGRKYQTPLIEEAARKRLTSDQIDVHAWTIFLLGCKHHDTALAYPSIVAFDLSTNRDHQMNRIQELAPEDNAKIPLEWFSLMLRYRLKPMTSVSPSRRSAGGGTGGEAHFVQSWSVVAEAFKEKFCKQANSGLYRLASSGSVVPL